METLRQFAIPFAGNVGIEDLWVNCIDCWEEAARDISPILGKYEKNVVVNIYL